MSEFTQAQKQASEQFDRPLAVIAGAGSGKTTVLVKRYLNALVAGLEPDNVLTVTFTTEAAAEMRDRICRALADHPQGSQSLMEDTQFTKEIGTLHSFCYRILDKFGSHIQKDSIQSIVSPFQLTHAFESNFRDWHNSLDSPDLDFLAELFNPMTIRTAIRQGYEQRFAIERSLSLKNFNEQPEFPLLSRLWHLLAPLYRQIEEQLQSQGIYGFDELEQYCLQILTQVESVRKELQSQYRMILVDEFQDTSPLQWSILSTLVGEDWKKLFIVGDPKQSIYRFRHADVFLFRKVALAMKKRTGDTIEMRENFRSRSALLENINQYSAKLFDHSEIGYRSMLSPKTEDLGDLTPIVTLSYAGQTQTEAAACERKEITSYIQKLLSEGTQPKQIAILFRVSDRIRAMESLLLHEGIAASAPRSLSLFHAYAVLDIYNYLKALQNPLDDYSLSGFLRSPYVGYSQQEIWNLFEKRQSDSSLFQTLLENPDPKHSWLVATIEQMVTEVQPALQRLFSCTDYFPDNWETVSVLLDELTKVPLNVFEAVAKIQSWQKEDIHVQSPRLDAQNAVRLLTVHAAKGLEFDYVILADNLRLGATQTPTFLHSPGEFAGIRYRKEGELFDSPNYEKLKKQERSASAEESKRILYVAMTRAKSQLIFCLPQNEKLIRSGSWASRIKEFVQ